MERASFLDQQPPAGYIAGVGRGATGFSTRGDSNKNKIPKRFQDSKNNSGHSDEINRDSRDILLSNDYLTKHSVDKEEEEAEGVFAAVDAKLSDRNKAKKEASSEEGTHGLHQQFSDLKRSLATVTPDEWLNIPDAGDITKKHKRERLQNQLNRKDYAAPDSLIYSQLNLSKLTEEREKLLVRQLDANLLERGRQEDSELTNSSKEAQAYLNELELYSSSKGATKDQTEDVKNMRLILQSYRKADPKRPEGWIVSARLEEKAGKLQKAQTLIEEGCQKCPKNEDVWLENIRLNSSDARLCKGFVAEGIAFNPQSLQLWLKAVDLESEVYNKRRVVRKALQEIPSNEELWKLAIKFENDKSEACRVLQKAVEFVPKSIELWKALVQIQGYEEAKKSLNTARKLLPTELQIWILAAQLEERHNSDITIEKLEKLLLKGMNDLVNKGIHPSLSVWLGKAQLLEGDDRSPKSAIALVQAAMKRSLNDSNEVDKLSLIEAMGDTTTKIVAYRILLYKHPAQYSIWKSLRSTCERALKMEELYSTFENILFGMQNDYNILKENPVLSLMYSKEVWKYGQDTSKALDIIEKTLKIVPHCLDIWLAKIKILCLSSQYDRVEEIFLEAMMIFEKIEVSHPERLYYKYVSFLRFQGRNDEAIIFLEKSCFPKFPKCHKFYIQRGQIYHKLGKLDESRESYSIGTKKLPHCAVLWVLLAKVDEIDFNKPTKARSELDIAVRKNPDEELLYLAKVHMEKRLGNYDQARLIVFQSLQKFPKSPSLWAENIRLLATKRASLKRSMFQDALKNSNNSCEVLIEIGLSFFQESQYSTALKWFERATKTNPLNGDAWVFLTRCLKRLKKDLDFCYVQVKEHEPMYGAEWISISKNIEFQYCSSSEILIILTREKDAAPL